MPNTLTYYFSYVTYFMLRLVTIPPVWTEDQARVHLEDITQWLAEEANARGAKQPPDLSVIR
jgi:hypothetical protein